jgi:protein-tyrosine phosphatase
MVDPWMTYRRASKGWQTDPPAKVHPAILFGCGESLTPLFVKKHNITHVINCAFNDDSPEWFRHEFPFNYFCINAEDSTSSDIRKWFPLFEYVMSKYLKYPDSKVIYVHCQCGINRSGFLTLMYICKHFGYTFEASVKNILMQRPCALTNPTYFRQCQDYIKNLS